MEGFGRGTRSMAVRLPAPKPPDARHGTEKELSRRQMALRPICSRPEALPIGGVGPRQFLSLLVFSGTTLAPAHDAGAKRRGRRAEDPACETPRGNVMKLVQRAIWALLLSAAVAGFADNLGRTSPLERTARVQISSPSSATVR